MKTDWIIIERVLNGSASAEEARLFDRWLEQSPAHREQFARIRAYYENPYNDAWRRSTLPKEGQCAETIIRNSATRKRPGRLYARIAVWSAAAIVAIAVGTLYVSRPDIVAETSPTTFAPSESRNNDIILKTGSGQVMPIESGNVSGQIKGVELAADANMLSYEAIAEDGGAATVAVEYHTLVVPRGKTYKLKLADGTVVHLNADSELRYPVAFTGDERRVYLRGEAYFEVEHDETHRFVVSIGEATVKVYGTRFNVSAYGGKVETVLVDGSVSFEARGRESRIVPGQRALYIPGGEVAIHRVDVSKYISWTQGHLTIEDEKLIDIRERLEQIYNIRIVFENDAVKNLVINCHILKGDSIDTFLRGVEGLGKVRYHSGGGVYYLR